MRKQLLMNAALSSVACMFFIVVSMAIAGASWAYSFDYIRNNPDRTQTLAGHVPFEVKNRAAAFKSHTDRTITTQVILPLRNQEALDRLLQDIYDPDSRIYQRWLTPDEFNLQFAPTKLDADFVKEQLERAGLSVTGSANGTVLYVSGPISRFERVFGLRINHYQRNNGTVFFAPDTDPTIPAALAGKILAIGGLDSFPKYQALHDQLAKAAPKVGTGPGGFLAPADIKTAYNLNGLPATGAGQTMALFELDGYNSNDIKAYQSYFNLPAVPLTNIYIDGFNGRPDYITGGAAEVTLDIQIMAAIAPGASICVYEAPNSTQSWINEWTRIAADNTAKIVSCSWGMTEQDSPTRAFDYNIFQQMATQGQAVFVASGDNGAYNGGGTTLAVDEPACQPYVTAVGISKLTMGANSSYVSETASVYGGGGVSAYLAIPSYQAPLAVAAAKTAKVSTTKRNLPDVALTADAATPYAFYINGTWGGYYGSSISAPIWAAFTACVNEGLGSKGPIGFVNPALYQLAQTSNYTGYFHDITTGNNKYYPAALNFDDATGLGSFNGLNLYNGLVNGFAIDLPPSAPTITSVTAGNAQVSLSWTAVTGATSYVVTRSASSSLANPTVFTGITATTYTNTSLANGTTYYYAVAGVNAAGQGSNSTVVSATPSASVSSVAAPTNLTGSATTYMKMPAFALQWKQSVSPNITRNNIYYSIGNGGYSKLGNVPATTSITVIIIGASRGVTYNFYVTAVNSKGVEGPGSNKIGVVL